MICRKCGIEIKEGWKFCENCGAATESEKLQAAPEKKEKPKEKTPEKTADKPAAPAKKRAKKEPAKTPEGKRITENITLCTDGKYRWVYEMNLLKNPSVYILVWKIFFFIMLGIMTLTLIADWKNRNDFFPTVLLKDLKIYGFVMLGMTVIVIISCLIHAASVGGKYCVMFEMDDKGVNHRQMPNTVKKSELISLITVLAGLAAGNAATVGIGMNAARTEMYSEFAKTRKVISYPKRGLIKVNGVLSHNQVYAEKEDFDFVSNFINARTANAGHK